MQEIARSPQRRMAKYRYGDSQADIRQLELFALHQRKSPLIAGNAPDPRCRMWWEGVSACTGRGQWARLSFACVACGAEHPIGDSEMNTSRTPNRECASLRGHGNSEITVGVSLSMTTAENVRIDRLSGCRCAKCGLPTPYADWKNEISATRTCSLVSWLVADRGARPAGGLPAGQDPARDRVRFVPVLPEMLWTWAVFCR